jgi:alpha-ribazole phosphatase/probable phosphoglycerate mutase
MLTYYLVRHGQTDWLPGNPSHNRYQSRTDVPLSESGRAQARRVAARVREVPFICAVSSDLTRSAETAQLALVGRDVPLILDPDLREIDVGEWEGLTGEEVWQRYPKIAARRNLNPIRFTPPGGESITLAAERFGRSLARANGTETRGNVLLVSHQNALRVVAALLLGLPLRYHRRFRFDPASITIIERDGKFGNLVVSNDTCHLDLATE